MWSECCRSRPFPDTSRADSGDLCVVPGDWKNAVLRCGSRWEKGWADRTGMVFASVYDFCNVVAGVWQLFYLSGFYFSPDQNKAGEGGSWQCDSAIFHAAAF